MEGKSERIFMVYFYQIEYIFLEPLLIKILRLIAKSMKLRPSKITVYLNTCMPYLLRRKAT